MKKITIIDQLNNLEKDFTETLSQEESILFLEFMKVTKLNEKESLAALIRFVKFPKTYERFDWNYDVDLTVLLEKAIDFLNNHINIDEATQIKKVTAKDIQDVFVENSVVHSDDIWL